MKKILMACLRWKMGWLVVLFLVAATGCKPAGGNETAAADVELTAVFESALLTATYGVAVDGQSATEPPAVSPTDPPVIPSKTLTASQLAPTPEGTPLPLPIYESSKLLAGVTTQTYLADKCTYLQYRWDPARSEPGTVVVPVMYHSIVGGGKEITDNMQVSEEEHNIFLNTAKAYDFEAITMAQFSSFMYENGKIPPRSMLLIVDDRHKDAYFRLFFRPYYDAFGWPVINGWISTPYSDEDLWSQQVGLFNEGWVDYQAHGVDHSIPLYDYKSGDVITSKVFGTLPAEEFLYREISDPINIYMERFGKRPDALIWPMGFFGIQAVEIARAVDYKLGFTVYERGPIMFDWVPLGPEERAVNDPLMVLPRYWSFAAAYRLDDVIQTSDEAKAFADQNRQQELDWYRVYCPGYPALPPN
jgi:hypothetical protein